MFASAVDVLGSKTAPAKMSGQIFISYRREDSSAWAGRLSDRLSSHFPSNQIFMDVDTIEPGIDFVEAIEESVGSCDVLIAVIGTRWLNASNSSGKRRLEVLEDSVRVEISTALKRGIRVIPVLVEGATMPEAADLPDDLKPLARRNALQVNDTRFEDDFRGLATAIEQVIEQVADHRERLEKERLKKKRPEMEQDRLSPEQLAKLLTVLSSVEFPKKTKHRAFSILPEPERKPVDCTVFAPDRVERKQSALLQVFLHTPNEQQQAEANAIKSDREAKERGQ